jgi:hypothetical protein
MRTKHHYIDNRAELVQVDADEWIVLVGGIQWGPLGVPRDASGCADTVFPTKAAARKAYLENEARLASL